MRGRKRLRKWIETRPELPFWSYSSMVKRRKIMREWGPSMTFARYLNLPLGVFCEVPPSKGGLFAPIFSGMFANRPSKDADLTQSQYKIAAELLRRDPPHRVDGCLVCPIRFRIGLQRRKHNVNTMDRVNQTMVDLHNKRFFGNG